MLETRGLPNKLYIGAEWVDPESGETEPVLNPATEEVIGDAPVGGLREADAAIGAAREAFDSGDWAAMKPKARAAILQRFYDSLMSRADEIRALITAEAGATVAMTHGLQFDIAMQHAQYFIDISTRDPSTSLPVEVISTPRGDKMLGGGVMVREPVGVVAAITPFNFPFFLNTGKVFPALAAGNTVVLKPSPMTPYEALIMGQSADEAGLPPGVFNIVTGGLEVGECLTTDKRVDLITFTGSDAVGAKIQAQAAPSLKRLLLELGGKSAQIVCADADLNAAAMAALISITQHAGQSCAAMTRLIVHNSVRDAFTQILRDKLNSLKIGNPADPSVQMGPLIRESQRRRVESYVELGLSEGARLVTGGKRPDGLTRGFFYAPTVFDQVENSWRIAQEEVFGPVTLIIGFDEIDEAVRIANDSEFGLAGGVFSADVGRAYEIGLRIRTGRMNINGGSGSMSSHAPFGGIKRSGYGREYGFEGLNEYTYIKSIAFHGG